MNLQLNHLSPYLPYNLKLYNNQGIIRTMYTFESNDKSINIEDVDCLNYRPILKPFEKLSDEEIFINFLGERKIEYTSHPVFYSDQMGYWHHSLKSESLTKNPIELYMFFEKLFEHHYDVFGLIPKGLAMNINEPIIKALAKK